LHPSLVLQADIVQLGNITSSPGSISRAPIIQISPEVHEFTEIAFIGLKYF